VAYACTPGVDIRLLIMGVPARATAAEITALLGHCPSARVQPLVPQPPGNVDDVVWVVRLPSDSLRAARMAQRINHSRLHGRHMLSWVPAMAWPDPGPKTQQPRTAP
jgi:hypothetical protein